MKTKISYFSGTARAALLPFVGLTNISSHYIENYLKIVHNLETCKGQKETVRILKLYQLWVRNATIGITLPELPYHKCNRKGFPKVFNPWKNLINSHCPDHKRMVNTIFGSVKGITLPVDRSTETITSPSTSNKQVVKRFCDYIRTWSGVSGSNLKLQSVCLLRSTKGPNGPAMVTCLKDLSALLADTKLLGDVRELIKLTCIPAVSAIIESHLRRLTPSGCHSRIRFLQDRAGKTRVVAIADYWSQLALYPVHELFIDLLRNIKTDCTYRQGILKTVLKLKTAEGKFVGTADITAFTDRFPREPQIQLVTSVLGVKVAEAWIKVVCERKFTVDSTDTFINYSVGTPMGVYSSWAVATITLHALVEYSAYEMGFKHFRGYLVLGDDVAIFEPSVYHRFLENVASLGVQISSVKSTESNHSAEMAKRFFSHGQEVTGFPVFLLPIVKRHPVQVLEVLRLLMDLGYCKVPVIPVLKLMGITLKSRYSALLSIPHHLGGYPDAFSDIASYEGNIEGWLWPKAQIDYCREAVTQDEFWEEIQRLRKHITKLEQSQSVDNALASTPGHGLPEDHPLIFALSAQLEEYLSVVIALGEEGSPKDLFEKSGRVYSLMFPPVSHPYTHRFIGQRRATKISHVNLEVLKRLQMNDVSRRTEDQSFDTLFNCAFESAVVRPGS